MTHLPKDLYLFIVDFWPHIALILSLSISIPTAIHAAMTKQEVRAAIGWVGVIILSPFMGSFLYFIVGINKIRKTQITELRDQSIKEYSSKNSPPLAQLDNSFSPQLSSLQTLGDHISHFQLRNGNHIQLLAGGDEAYPAMLAAINEAEHSIALQSYIFDSDRIGKQFADALIRAKERGVQIRVLIDSIGAKYSHPPIHRFLRKQGITCALFMSTSFLPLSFIRRPYTNLRSHRKMLIVDGHLAFAGGMNIRESFYSKYSDGNPAQDTHFSFEGPVVLQLMSTFAHDWEFTTKENLSYDFWCACVWDVPMPQVPARCIRSGPDRFMASNHSMLQGAFATANKHIRIQSPYFLPDQVLMGAIITAAMRGVRVDIVIPKHNNLVLVSRAMMAQIDEIIAAGCKVWLNTGPFNHSKLITIDGQWSYVGSSNMDPRSLRLNFELDVEIYCHDMAKQIEELIDAPIKTAEALTLDTLKKLPFKQRLINRVIWLASPYL